MSGELLVVDVWGQLCALPVSEVERVMPLAELSQVPGSPSELVGVLPLPGRAIDVYDLGMALEIPPTSRYDLGASIIELASTRGALGVVANGSPQIVDEYRVVRELTSSLAISSLIELRDERQSLLVDVTRLTSALSTASEPNHR